jgi:hypothetical protein
MIILMMEAASTSETSVGFYQATLRNTQKDSHVQVQLILQNFKYRVRKIRTPEREFKADKRQ